MSSQNISVIDFIKNGKTDEVYKKIKEFEDSINKLFTLKRQSSLLNDNYLLLHNVYESADIFVGLNDKAYLIDYLSKFIDFDKIKNTIIMGPLIRSIFVPNEATINNILQSHNIVELFFYDSFNTDCLVDFANYVDMGKYYTNGRIVIYKQVYLSPTEIILSPQNYLHRVGFDGDNLYASSMLLLEYQTMKTMMGIDIVDPIYNTPYDVFNVSCLPVKINGIHEYIEQYDYDNLKQNITNENYETVKNGLIPIELALQLYLKQTNSELLNELIKIIKLLSKYIYRKPIKLSSKYIGLSSTDTIMNIIKLIKNKYNYTYDISINNNVSVDYDIIKWFIKNDNADAIIDYISFYDCNIDTDDYLELINCYKAEKCLKLLIDKKKVTNSHDKILYCEMLNLLRFFDSEIDTNNINISRIVTSGKYNSLFLLLKLNPHLINFNDTNNKTLLHMCNKNFDEIFKVINHYDLDKTLINKKDNNEKTPLFYFINDCSISELKNVLSYYQNIDLSIKDKNGSSILHELILLNKPEHLACILNNIKTNIQINIKNNNGETPILLACKYGNEKIYKLFYSFGADILQIDTYGNSVYHYMCKNSICIGEKIILSRNYFGYSPLDYSTIKHTFWKYE
jgi:ankyrin repeat protein